MNVVMMSLVNLADLDILRNRVRCSRCGRWVDRLFLLTDWSLACYGCTRRPVARAERNS